MIQIRRDKSIDSTSTATLLRSSNEFIELKKEIRLSEDEDDEVENENNAKREKEPVDWMKELTETSPVFQLFRPKGKRKMPPLTVDDVSLLFYDVSLILNLTVSISFWVVHRISFSYIGASITEASLMSILWVVCGFFNGAFLYTAVDGNYDSTDKRAGPKAAALMGLNTYIGAASLRVIYALLSAMMEHRKVGIAPGEDLILQEIFFGLILMSSWRALHSSYTPRI